MADHTRLFQQLLPLEIVKTIIALVAEQDGKTHKNLKACSLTCRRFISRCRKHIFITIATNTDNFDRFFKLVANSPWIAHNVHDLMLSVRSGPLNKIPPAAFDHLKSLRSLRLHIHHSWQRCRWMDIQPLIRYALLRLMHLPTISTLGFTDMVGIPPSDIALCPNLNFLVIHDSEFTEDERSTKLSSVIKLKKLAISPRSVQNMINVRQRGKTTGQSIFDLGELEYVSIDWERDSTQHYRQLLEDAHTLQTMRLCIQHRSSDISSLLNNSLGSLKNLRIRISSFQSNRYEADTISLLCNQLQIIAHSNVIEFFSLNLLIDETLAFRLEKIQLDSLDKLLLTPGNWPSLKQFDLWIYVDRDSTHHPAHSRQFEKAVENVRASKLSRLISSKLFEFRFFFHPDFQDHFTYLGL